MICPTCNGSARIRIVNDLYRPERDEDCPVCVGWPIPGLTLRVATPGQVPDVEVADTTGRAVQVPGCNIP